MNAGVPKQRCGTVPSTIYIFWENINSMSNPLGNIEQYKLAGSAVRDIKRNTTTVKPQSWFLKGPIPGDWLGIASGLPGRSIHVGLVIWFKHGLTKKNQIQISRKDRERFNIPDDAFRRGLISLEKSGLIRVERRLGRPSIISIIHTSTDRADQ